MDSFAQGIRFFFGAGMVAAGSALAVPTCLCLVEFAAQRPHQVPAVSSSGEETDWHSRASAWPPAPTIPVDHVAAAPSQRLEYVAPPPPPERLPPGPQALAAANPDLALGYRPTLQSPPPPLLDAHTAPPLAVGWTPRYPDIQAGVAASPAFASEQPRIYVVRDGDDLTGIASRFYGHPAAASAIWEANRGLLRDPGLLPIGAALVLPPQSAVAALARPSDQGVIEPVSQGRPEVPPTRETISQPASWLSGAGAPTGPVPLSL